MCVSDDYFCDWCKEIKTETDSFIFEKFGDYLICPDCLYDLECRITSNCSVPDDGNTDFIRWFIERNITWLSNDYCPGADDSILFAKFNKFLFNIFEGDNYDW